jgi:nucleotide-binding universal stress UspA family protein
MYSKIVVGTDGSGSATRAVERAVELARRLGAELLVVHAHPEANVGYGLSGENYPEIARGQEILAEAESRHAADVAVRTVLRKGEAAESLLDVAEEEGADLIVVGNKGMAGARRFLVGSVPNRVSHHSVCDVLIVHTT